MGNGCYVFISGEEVSVNENVFQVLNCTSTDKDDAIRNSSLKCTHIYKNDDANSCSVCYTNAGGLLNRLDELNFLLMKKSQIL